MQSQKYIQDMKVGKQGGYGELCLELSSKVFLNKVKSKLGLEV